MAQKLLSPTFEGYIATHSDAELLVKACVHGEVNLFPRRPIEEEYGRLIRSGHVFVCEESHIKRWTDGKSWTSGRAKKGFVEYDEVEPKKQSKRAKMNLHSPELNANASTTLLAIPENKKLKKKSVTITNFRTTYRVISYYTLGDIKTLLTPSGHRPLKDLPPISTSTGSLTLPSSMTASHVHANHRDMQAQYHQPWSGGQPHSLGRPLLHGTQHHYQQHGRQRFSSLLSTTKDRYILSSE
jgi:Gti1/Pac2 family